MQIKLCRKCLGEFPATLEFFYKNAGGKFGLTPRCKPCVNEDNARTHAKRKAKDPEKVKAQAVARSKKHYYNNLDKCREISRKSAAKAHADPIKKLRIQARKRAGYCGLTPEDLELLFQSQGCKCAICDTTAPQGIGGANGWNVDHCHKSGKVRFILCPPCNRGLGAFKDSPASMRRAADLIEQFNASLLEE